MSAAQPTAGHPGRRASNFSIFDAGDLWIDHYKSLYTGLLVDLGCGNRCYEAFLAGYCDHYVGVDWGKSMHGVHADAIADLSRALPIRTDSVDTVLCVSVLEHVSEPSILLAEAYRILKPGGWMVLQVPFMWQVHEAPHDYFRYTCFGLQHMLSKAGFQQLEVTPTTGFWLSWTLKLNYQLERPARGQSWPRRLLAVLLWPFFSLNQRAAAALDRWWPGGESETAGYFAIGRKRLEGEACDMGAAGADLASGPKCRAEMSHGPPSTE